MTISRSKPKNGNEPRQSAPVPPTAPPPPGEISTPTIDSATGPADPAPAAPERVPAFHNDQPKDEIRRHYEMLLVAPDDFIDGIEHDNDPERVYEGVRRLGDVVPILLERGNYGMVQKIFKMFDRLCAGEAAEQAGMNQPLAVCVSGTLLDTGVMDYIEEMLGSEVSEIRKTGAQIARSLGAAAIPALVSALESVQSVTIRRSLCELCLEIGEIAVPVLTSLLKQREAPWFLYRNLIMLLGELASPSAVDVILPWLRHDDERVRMEVLDTLVKLIGPDAEKHIIPMLNDHSPNVIIKTMECLIRIGSRNPDVVSFYLDSLNNPASEAESGGVEIAARAALNLGALGNIIVDRNRNVEAFLIDQIAARRRSRLAYLLGEDEDMDEKVRAAIYEALGRVGGKKALKIMLKMRDKTKLLNKSRVDAIRKVESRLNKTGALN